jgi:hypothetical protein
MSSATDDLSYVHCDCCKESYDDSCNVYIVIRVVPVCISDPVA